MSDDTTKHADDPDHDARLCVACHGQMRQAFDTLCDAGLRVMVDVDLSPMQVAQLVADFGAVMLATAIDEPGHRQLFASAVELAMRARLAQMAADPAPQNAPSTAVPQ